MTFHHDYDLLIVGGGVAGCAAAITAGRAGLRVALVEKTILLGGLATSGLVNTYLPLCDGRGNQVMFGLAEELMHRSLHYGPGGIPPGWNGGPPGERSQRFLSRFIPASLALALDEVLLEAGVALWLDALACDPLLESNRLVGVEVETANRRGALKAECVIDASGDAALLARAGAECVEGDNWMTSWALQYSEAALQKAHEQPSLHGLAPVFNLRLGAGDDGRNAIPGYPLLRGAQPGQVTHYVLESRRLLREHYHKQYAAGEGRNRNNLFPLTLPSMAQLRTIRRIAGQETLRTGQENTPISTSIGLVTDWRKPGMVWEVPYGALLPQRLTGVLAAGRCISAEGEGWQVTRTIPAAALTGQVAAIAAHLALQRHTTPDRLDVQDIQNALAEAGIAFHLSQIYG